MTTPLFNEKLDSKGLRTHCPYCNTRLTKRNVGRGGGKPKGETCSGCDTYIHYNPLLDLPYNDTNIPIEQSKREIQEYLLDMGLRKIGWSVEFLDSSRSHVLDAVFEDGTGFHISLPAIVESKDDTIEKQMMRIFYHYIKAISVVYQLGILSKSEMMLGLLKVGESNLGRVVNTDQMLSTMANATKLLGGDTLD